LEEIVIVANIKVKEEFKDEVYSELIKLYKSTHKYDEGCIQYELHKDLSDKNSFSFVETWENPEFLALHEQKEHFKTFVAKIENKIENLTISKLEKLDI
jgi:quinol monooxygenase YgiN